MNIAGPRILCQAFQGQLRSSSKLKAMLAATSCNFSTSKQCVQQSSEKEFILKHQTQPGSKSSNSNWLSYRVVSLGLLGSLAGCVICPGNFLVDTIAVTFLVHHNHFGLKSVIADYAPLFFGDTWVNAFMWMWLVVSIITLSLLYNFNYNNVGFSKALVNFFKL